MKIMNQVRFAVPVALLATAGSAFAAGGADYSAITSAVDATAIVTAIGAIAVVMFAPTVAKWGFRKVMSMLGR